MRDVKIQCTIGPACNDPEILAEMMEAGMDVARVNLSHGSAESQADKLENFRRAAKMTGKEQAAIMFDIRGPEIRVKEIPGERIFAAERETLVLRCEGVEENGVPEYDENATKWGSYAANIIRVNYENLCDEVVVGTEILIDDGKVSLTVESVKGRDIVCYVDRGGTIESRKGVNVPDVKLQMDYLGDDDRDDILWCIANGVDYVACSFIRRKADVDLVRNLLDSNGGRHIGLIAKIENKEAISNIEAIAEAADQVLIARGDMGVEIGFEKVPAVQKRIIRRCRERGKAVILATQLIDSMIENKTPTRAEVSDIANAVFDGATDLLVTGETAAGKYPVQVVREMAKIIEQAEHDAERYGSEIL
ncbi:MAG: pyruvate kinase [Bacillota bacterium]